MEKSEVAVRLTTLGKTWLLDLDGTLVKHNGYKLNGKDTLLPGAEVLLSQIRPEDTVVILTSRSSEYQSQTESFLQKYGIRYDYMIFNLPYGERILVNDKKPSGREMAFAVNTERDNVCTLKFIRDSEM